MLHTRRAPSTHTIRYIERPDPLHDARPGSLVSAYVSEGGGLAVARLTWGFPLDGKPNAVFNTRIESALEQLRLDGRSMWAKAIAEDHCLVPVCAFYESHTTEKVESERTGRPVRSQYLFRPPEPGRSCSPSRARATGSRLSPPGRTPVSRPSTIACRSCSGPVSRAPGSVQALLVSRTVIPSG